MSARALQRVTAFLQPGRLSLAVRCASSSSSSGDSGKKAKDVKAKDGKPKEMKAKPKPKEPFEQPKTTAAPKQAPPPPPPPPPEVKFDNSKYQAQEQFQYNPMSFYDIETSMTSSRCPRQSSLSKTS